MAVVLAAITRAFARLSSPASAIRTAFAEAVSCSICDDAADSLRSNNASNGINPAPTSASNAAMAAVASAAAVRVSAERRTTISEILGTSAARYGLFAISLMENDESGRAGSHSRGSNVTEGQRPRLESDPFIRGGHSKG
jgi:hypothetical protein